MQEQSTKRKGVHRREFVAWSSILAGAAASGSTTDPSHAYSPLSKQYTATMSSSMDSASPSSSSPIIPFSSVRRYKSISLNNGMKVLLVSDKTARMSSAALTIRGAGQFSDPPYLSGLAHLMEHICLSSTTTRRRGDFEEWLNGDYADGFSNGFTAYEKVCFHFQCQTEAFSEALERFSRLFLQDVVQQACNNRETVRREIRRVNAELDRNDMFTRELYLTKSLINPQHPYSKMSMGSLETLERLPAEADININQELFNFFQTNYQPSRAILVVVGPSTIGSLEGWVQPFSSAFSRNRIEQDDITRITRTFPDFLLPRNPINTYCLFRKKSSADILADNLEKITFQWALDQDYSELLTSPASNNVVTATQIGFVMAEILGRRGPGTLYTVLKARKWVPDGSKGVPRISFPLDVTGCQIMRLELTLTLDGFANRSSVIATVFDCLTKLRGNVLSRELIAQYCTVAQLFGHVLAPRPSDAIELAFDGQIYGVDHSYGVGSGNWLLLPLPDNNAGVRNLQRAMQQVFDKVSDPSNAITIVTASQRAIQSFDGNVFEEPFPLFSPASWEISPITGARYLAENNLLTGKINGWLATVLKEGSLLPPVLNPLIPPSIRPPRVQSMTKQPTNELLQDLQVIAVKPTGDVIQDPIRSSIVQDYWSLLKVFSHDDSMPVRLSLPRISPEPSPRTVFVLQLLSSRPPRASAKMAANAETWKISLEYALSDLAELGIPGGLSYEITFNKFGMRIAFLGLSQNVASYARRISRRIVDHQNRLLEGPETISELVVETSIREASRFRMSPQRKTLIVNLLREATALDASKEAALFFQSCSGAVAFAQGDMLPSEAVLLLGDLKKIFRKVIGSNVSPSPAIPDIEADLMYRANWLPRSASTCGIAGASLISNPCGRVPR